MFNYIDIINKNLFLLINLNYIDIIYKNHQ